MDRVIELHIDASQMTSITEQTKSWEALWGAIGYLSSWNLTYPKVSIFGDGPTDLLAVYYTADGQRGYVIGAVWHETHYGFHS